MLSGPGPIEVRPHVCASAEEAPLDLVERIILGENLLQTGVLHYHATGLDDDEIETVRMPDVICALDNRGYLDRAAVRAAIAKGKEEGK
jgi:hypothetical protein